MSGELGNQLFELAAAYSLAKFKEANIQCHYFESENRLKSLKLNNKVSFFYHSESSNVSLSRRAWLKLNRIIGIPSLDNISKRNRLFRESEIHTFDKRFFELEPPIEIEGYFQSWKYFVEHREELKEFFSLKEDESKLLFEFRKKLPEKFTSIHIRRGGNADAKLNTNFHGLLPLEYYKRAIEVANSICSVENIVIFTDNSALARDFLKDWMPPLDYVLLSREEISNQAVNLWLMSEGTSFIGANSSYSWWAAFLGNRRGPTIFPRPWYKELGLPERDLLMPDWLTVGFGEFL